VLELWLNIDTQWSNLFQGTMPASYPSPPVEPPPGDNLVILCTPAFVNDRHQLEILPTMGGGTLISGQIPDVRQIKFIEGVMSDVPAAPYPGAETVDTAALVISDMVFPQYSRVDIGEVEPHFDGFQSAFSNQTYGPFTFREFEEMWGFMEDEGPEGRSYEGFSDILEEVAEPFQNYVRNVIYMSSQLGSTSTPLGMKMGTDPMGVMRFGLPAESSAPASYLEMKAEELAEQAPLPKLPPGYDPAERFLRPPQLGPEE
jgi:hypothetical protein